MDNIIWPFLLRSTFCQGQGSFITLNKSLKYENYKADETPDLPRDSYFCTKSTHVSFELLTSTQELSLSALVSSLICEFGLHYRHLLWALAKLRLEAPEHHMENHKGGGEWGRGLGRKTLTTLASSTGSKSWCHCPHNRCGNQDTERLIQNQKKKNRKIDSSRSHGK